MDPIKNTIAQTNPAVIVEELNIEIEEAVKRVLNSGRYILGEEVEAFEREWAEWCGVDYAVGCANGTDGLELILRALDIPTGARVMAPSHTAVATISAIERAGCRPFLADVNSMDFTLDPNSAERCLEAAREEGDPIEAIIGVHLYGHPCNLDAIQRLCTNHNIPLIEDGSQAHGALWRKKRVGSYGVAAAFSLYPTKNLGALGDAGVITTKQHELSERMKQLRQYGWKQQGISEETGINSRLDPLQAAILRVKLKNLGRHNNHRIKIANEYQKHLINQRNLQLPQNTNKNVAHVYHQFVIKLPSEKREHIRTELKNAGISTLIHYPKAVHQMPAYRDRHWVGIDPVGLKATEELVPQILSLPMGPHLSIQDAKKISINLIEAINSFC